MKSFKDIREELQATARVDPGTGKDFWQVFRARAAHLSQESAPKPTFYRQHAFGIRWATAAASMAIIAGLALMYLQPSASYAYDTVQSIDVSIPHDSIYIMNDDSAKATIIWIEGI